MGQAARRGTYEERKAAAIKAGRIVEDRRKKQAMASLMKREAKIAMQQCMRKIFAAAVARQAEESKGS